MTAKIVFYIEAGQGLRGEVAVRLNGAAVTKTEFLKAASNLWDMLI